MNDEPYKPYKPEKTIVVTITEREAILVQKLRRYAYGKFIVHKANGLVIRLEINDSQLIEEGTPIDLE